MLDGGPRFQCLFLTALFWTLSWWRQCKAKGSMLQGTRFRAGRDFSKGGAAAWERAYDCCSGEALTLAWSEQAPCSATTHTPQAQFGQNSCLVLWLCCPYDVRNWKHYLYRLISPTWDNHSFSFSRQCAGKLITTHCNQLPCIIPSSLTAMGDGAQAIKSPQLHPLKATKKSQNFKMGGFWWVAWILSLPAAYIFQSCALEAYVFTLAISSWGS